MTRFIYFSGGLSLLFSVGQLFIRGKRPANYNLALMFLCLGFFIIQLGFIVDGTALARPGLLAFHLTFLYLLSPLLYIAYHLVVLPEEALPARWAFLALPSLFALAADIAFLSLGHDVRVSLLGGLFHSDGRGDITLVKLMYLGAAVQITAHLGFLARKLRSIWEEHDSRGVLGVTLAYTLLSIAPVVLLAIGVILSSLELLKLSTAGIALLMIGAYLAGQRYPKFLQLLIIEAERKRYRGSLVSGIDPASVISRLEAVMSQKRLYADEELSLKQAADEIDITPHQLSRILNETLNVNFNNYINKFRIDEASRLLVRDPERSVISVAYEVGFNSKSSFYDAFSRFTGKSPQAFRLEHKKSE